MKLTVINKKAESDGTSTGFFSGIFRIDFLQFIPMTLLLILGIVYIYSTGHQVGGNPEIWKKQLFYVVCGFAVWTFLAYVNYKLWAQWALIIYAAGITSLILVLFFGSAKYGATRWFKLFGVISVQPSEFAKLATLIFSAWVLSMREFNLHNKKHLTGFILITALPFLLIYKEPDLGSALTLLPVTATMLFVGGIRWKWIIIVAVVGITAVPCIYPQLKEYQKERIRVFLDPARDPTNKGWNSRQSQLAVGSGGLFGKGFGNSTQSTLGFLPKTVSNSDFIFSVIAEEMGFVGAASVLLCYLLLIFSAYRTAIIADDDFGRFLAVGIGTLIFIHSLVNIGMTIRLMPVTGLPLPLVSLGGSFIVSTMAALGILQSIYLRSVWKKTS